MKLPVTKEERDLLLFDLLEGNLTKEEEAYWHAYALKDDIFAHQLKLFKQSYLQDSLLHYPDHSALLKKTIWIDRFLKPWVAIPSVLIIGAIAFHLYPTKPTITKPIQTIKDTIATATIPLESDTADVTVVNRPADVPTQTEKKVMVPVKEATREDSMETPQEHLPVKHSIQDTMPPNTTVAAPPTNETEVKKDIPPTNQTTSTPMTKPTYPKEQNSGIRFRVKPSKKTKTTDFNY